MKIQKLLQTAPEHERIAAFQADDESVFSGLAGEQRVDLVLRQGVVVVLLADEDEFAAGLCGLQELWRNKPIVDDAVRRTNGRETLQSDEFRVTGSRTDEEDQRVVRSIDLSDRLMGGQDGVTLHSKTLS